MGIVVVRSPDTLSSVAPDLVIVLDQGPRSPSGDVASGAARSRGTRSDVVHVDGALDDEEIRRAVTRPIWVQLARRWADLDRSSTRT
jgi:hypothetical protein